MKNNKKDTDLIDRLELLAKEMEEQYNKCHFWKRGHIYSDGFKNGYKCMIKILNEKS